MLELQELNILMMLRDERSTAKDVNKVGVR